MKIGEFFVQLGVNAETTKVKDFVKEIGEIPMKVAGAIVALAGIEYEFTKLAAEAMSAAVGFEAFTAQTGLSAQDLQQWQNVAEQANVSAETVAGSLTSLQRQMAEIRLGRGNIAPFQLLGIDPQGNAFQVLDKLRDRIKGLDRATATNIIAQMGLSPEMMNVLTLSDQKFSQFSKTVAGMSEKQEQSFLKSKLALKQLGLEFRQFAFDHLATIIDEVTTLIDKMGDLREVFLIIGTVLAAAFSPLTAELAGLFILLEDFIGYKTGKDSLIGRALKSVGMDSKTGVREGLSTMVGDPGATGAMLADFIKGDAGSYDNPDSYLKGNADVAKARIQHVNITVHGTAPAHDMAHETVGALKRASNDASVQISNRRDRR